MKRLLIYNLFPLFVWQTCSMSYITPATPIKSEVVIKDTINFITQVQPIMVKNCSPCHFPGGKLYQKLPFDQDTTIINHETVILKRIKNEDENRMVRNFIQQNKNGLKEGH